MSEHEYNDLLFEISEKLDANVLPRLVFMCRNDIPKGSKDSIQNVLTLFEELEKRSRLGIDRLDTLKQILTMLKKRSLLKKVVEFENKRKAQSVGVISSLKRAASTVIGAVRLVCNFRTLAGGVVLVGSGLALRSCTSFEEYSDAFNKVVLPAFTKLVELSEGSSLCFTVQAETPSALNELWSIYKNGTLKHLLQEFLVSEEIKQLASGEDVEVTVCVDEQEYREAYLDLMFQQNQVSEKKDQTGQRRRKNSDSFLYLSPKEDKVTSMKLEQAENKWNFKMQVLEREIEKLRTEVAKAEDLQSRVEEVGGNALQKEKQEMPPKRTRRNSDSILYARSKENETILVLLKLRQEEIKFHQEKIESLENEIQKLKSQIQEAGGRAKESTSSKRTTGEGESFSWRQESTPTIPTAGEGIYFSRTQEQETQEGPAVKRFRPAATSDWQIGEFKAREIERPERSRKRRRRNSDSDLYCKARDEDNRERERKQETFLGEEKYASVQRFLEEVHETHSVVTLTSDSGHVTHGAASELGMEEISDDTPELCLKDLRENIISELEERLEGDIYSKRLFYQSYGINHKLLSRTKFYFIFSLYPDTPVKSLKDVFEALQLYDLLELLEQQTKSFTARSLRPKLTSDEIKKLRNTADRPTTLHSCGAVLIFSDEEDDPDVIGIKTFFTDLDTNSDVTINSWRDYARENKSIETAALSVIERWIQHQDDFTFFAMFDFSIPVIHYLIHDCLTKLVSRIPDKPKLCAFSSTYADRELPETLQVICNRRYPQRLLLEILNKRWQTLDLISMMAEFKRSARVNEESPKITITDSLSSLPRFKRNEEFSVSQ